jgi:hypothetical protein
MELQYQLSNGNWIDCLGRTEEFILLCEKYSKMSREQVLYSLNQGKKLRNDSNDWYSNCRIKPQPVKRIEPKIMVKCSCGHTIPEYSVMSASMGSSCPECYDRMSF